MEGQRKKAEEKAREKALRRDHHGGATNQKGGWCPVVKRKKKREGGRNLGEIVNKINNNKLGGDEEREGLHLSLRLIIKREK